MIGPLSTELPQPPTLHCARLVLRPLRSDDVPAVARLAGDRRVARQLADVPSPFPLAMAARWVEARIDRWARGGGPTYALVERGREQELIGSLSLRSMPRDLRAEIGYWLAHSHWGQGLASEAVQRALRWAFVEAELHRVYAQVIAQNRRSRRVLEKAGMAHEGTRREHLRKGRRFVDVEQYGILRSEWLTRQGQ